MSGISQIMMDRQARRLARDGVSPGRCEVEAALARRACYTIASARFFEAGEREPAALLLRLADGELALSKKLCQRV